MKKFVTLVVCCLFSVGLLFSQADRSISIKSSEVSAGLLLPLKEIVLPPLSTKEIADLDYSDAKNGHMPKVARNIPVNLGLDNAGSWSTLPNGDRIWQLKITSFGAQAVIPIFDKLYLPPGATLHVYMPGKEQIIGAFTNENTPVERAFCPGLVHGPACIIEYYEPASQMGRGRLHMDRTGHAYRWISPLSNNEKSGSASCEVNEICPEGDNVRDQIRSVVRIFIVGETGDGFCSGSLVNNVRLDCTPYILSAEHCTDGGVTANDFSQWVFYFNYEATTCAGSTGPETDVVNGCKKVADSEDGGGSTGSDFLLLKLNHNPPTAFNVYFAGWSTTSAAPASGVDIHHPSADIKKISTFSTPAISSNWGQVTHDTHWEVTWAATVDGDGVTEPGSSGSPLIDPQGFVVGHLTGGSSCCTIGGCGGGADGPFSPDFFGKVAYDWTLDGVADSVRLKPWLDPDNTNATSLPGMNPPCGSSIADDAGIGAINEPNGTLCSATFSPLVVLRNFGSNILTSVTINYQFSNGGNNTFAWTGNLIAGGSITVQLPSLTLPMGSNTFMAFTSNPNGQADANHSNDTSSSTFYISDAGGGLILNLTTDDQGSKTTWQLSDASHNVAVSGGPYPDLTGDATYAIPMCVPPGCYTFTIFSSSGNGMTTGENGNFTITDANGFYVYAQMSNPAFGAQEVHNFCLSPSAVENIAAIRLSVIPNPSTGIFNLGFDNNSERTIRVYDVLGKLLIDRKESAQNFALDLSAQSKGVYLLQIESAQGKTVQKLVLK